MKGTALLVAAVGLLLGGFNPVQAQPIPIVTFTDLTDGPPEVLITGAGSSFLSITTGPEVATVGGVVFGILPLGTTFAILTEPSTDPFGPNISDIVRLINFGDVISLSFFSDGAPGFDSIIPIGTVVQGLVETGDPQHPQNLSTQLGTSGFLVVQVISDAPGTVERVPEPASLTLLGLSALGMIGYAWRRSAVRK